MGQRRRVGAVTVFAVVWCLLVAAPPRAASQSASRRQLPSPGHEPELVLARGEAHDWELSLVGREFVWVDVEPVALGESDEWPMVTVVAPDEHVVYDSDEPSLAPSIDSRPHAVVSFMGDREGAYRLRVAARATPLRYRLRVHAQRVSIEGDVGRLEAHGLWRGAMRQMRQGSPNALRAAADTLNRALALMSRIDDAEGEALTLGSLASVHYRLSDAAQGTAAATRALAIWRDLGRDREEGVALSDLGVLAYLAYDRTTARAHYDQALAKHRAAGDVLSEARTLTRLGWVQYAAAELQDVVDTSHEALALYRRVGDAAGESIAYNDLGRAYIDLGEITQALDALQRALALRPADRDARGAANVLIRMALVYLNLAEWQQALDALQQALALARRAEDIRTEGAALVNLGSAYVTLGDTTEGRRHLEPGLAIARSIDFRGAEAYALLWLGIGASLDGDPARSRDYLQQAIAIQTAIKDVRGEATTLRQLAAAQLALALPQDALASVSRSIEISPQASGLIYTGALSLASVYEALGDVTRADEQYREALERFREIRARHAEVLALTRYARFQSGRGLHDEARALLDQALDTHESLRGLIVDPDLRMSYTSTWLGPYRLQVDVLMALDRRAPGTGFAERAFHTNERARARGLLDLLIAAGLDVHQGVDRALVERERALRWKLNAKAGIQTRLLAGTPDRRRLDALEREIADLSREWRETMTAIRRQSPAYASLTEPRPATVDDTRALLAPDTILLAFAPGETRSWLFAVTTETFESFELPKWQSIDEAARDVHRLMTARQPVPGEPAARRQARIRRADADLVQRTGALSELVLGPVADRLAADWRGRRLVLVAAGALEYVPFGALPLPARPPGTHGPALVTQHEIVTLPSASTLAVLRQEDARRAPARKAVAVIADPVFSADDPRVARAGGGRPSAPGQTGAAAPAPTPATAQPAATRGDVDPADGVSATLARLPFSRSEADAVATQVPRAALLRATDFDASLALATSDRLADYRVVHFATHGVIDVVRPELSGLALSLVDASGRQRDGFLRLNTIYNLRLSSDLVVLSACQTGLGKEVAGEGLVGLTRGFMHAGARGVIASLWQVNDVATAELMKRFYAGLLRRKLPPAAALRAAQLEVARDPRWASPYYWAGFVLQGDWTP